MINIKVFWYTALTFICFICFSFEDTDALDATKAIISILLQITLGLTYKAVLKPQYRMHWIGNLFVRAGHLGQR